MAKILVHDCTIWIHFQWGSSWHLALKYLDSNLDQELIRKGRTKGCFLWQQSRAWHWEPEGFDSCPITNTPRFYSVTAWVQWTLLGCSVTASNKACWERNHCSPLHWWSFGEIQYCWLWEVEVADTDDTYSNSSSASSMLVIYSFKWVASRRDRDGEPVLFMVAEMLWR